MSGLAHLATLYCLSKASSTVSWLDVITHFSARSSLCLDLNLDCGELDVTLAGRSRVCHELKVVKALRPCMVGSI